MAYLGTPPQSGFITTAKQRVTSSTNNYVDLDHAISSIADVIVFVNFVKQDTTNLSLTTSTRITLGGTLVSSDIVEIHYLGKAVNTQTPSTGTVTLDMLSASGTKSSSTFLRGDNTFASAGGDNTPAFLLLSSGNTSISDNTWTKLTFGTETLDTDSACSTSRFTVPSGEGGYYQISFSMNMGGTTDGQGNYVQYKLYKNGSEQSGFGVSFNGNPGTVIEEADLSFSGLINLAASDYLEVYGRMDVASGAITTNTGHFSGFKLIGVS